MKKKELIQASRRDYAHASSAGVSERRTLYTFEADQLEVRINNLIAALRNARKRKNVLDALIEGLDLVLERR